MVGSNWDVAISHFIRWIYTKASFYITNYFKHNQLFLQVRLVEITSDSIQSVSTLEKKMGRYPKDSMTLVRRQVIKSKTSMFEIEERICRPT